MHLKVCRHPGCREIAGESGYCARHKADADAPAQKLDRHRQGTAASRGYGYRWQKLRAWWLGAHPYCEECLKRGRFTAATDVDHIVPHKGDRVLFWDEKNLQSLCHECHSRKTASEDGGFGNRRR